MMLKKKYPHGAKLEFASNNHEFKQCLSRYIGETEKNLILVDRNTEKFCLPVLMDNMSMANQSSVISIDAGEKGKNIRQAEQIWNELMNHEANRQSTLINLGGGVITDLGGFVASTYKRGIRFINIPTSLMGMADAAIGGKTAVNIHHIKNQIGTFALPEAVLIYPAFLQTLPKAEMLSGFAEVVKTALTFDVSLFNRLLATSVEALKEKHIDLIFKTAKLKNKVTTEDPRDLNIRQCLNFGHTLGHAFESFYNQKEQEIRHGNAVAAGMICETFISRKISGLSDKEMNQIQSLLEGYFPRLDIAAKDIDQLLSIIKHDKKVSGKEIKLPLLTKSGNCRPHNPCPEYLIRESLEYYISCSA